MLRKIQILIVTLIEILVVSPNFWRVLADGNGRTAPGTFDYLDSLGRLLLLLGVSGSIALVGYFIYKKLFNN